MNNSLNKPLEDWCMGKGISYKKCVGKNDTYYVFEKHLDLESDEGVSLAINNLFGERQRRFKVTLASFFCEDPQFLSATLDYIESVLL